ncbi:MAG: hypothetical protein KA180_12415 [Gemmatimonadales bacterium]|jgi:hypothetical protein|nr:hypothetical protein [Gemmatimonadota bacterium]MBP6670245.1 hypothetical protein [Gemmatimonadales bacterium]MBK7349318.1 hypothetical protein [Gemmatimonadota bacterium]MBK7783946.1 hypothetical protein [Gemmatimonadota bacterium]MBK9068007.1 hypothetical protein [Gemmatimonadota bacterium]
MCAYNVRKNKSVDHEPASGAARTLDFFRDLGIWAAGVGALYLVYWLARRYLF